MRVVCTPLGMYHVRDHLVRMYPKVDFRFTKGIATKTETENILQNEKYVVIGSEKLTKDFIERSSLAAVARFGGSVENIDVDALKEKDIPLFYTKAEGVADDVANLTVSFVLSASFQVASLCNLNKAGVWRRPSLHASMANVLIIGAGRIGGLVETKLAALGYSNVRLRSARELHRDSAVNEISHDLDWANIIVLTANPLYWDQEFFMDSLSSLNSGVSIVNTARGSLVDEARLISLFEHGLVREYYADVTAVEPPDEDTTEFISHASVVCTPHIGGYGKANLLDIAVKCMDFLEKVEYA